MDRLIDQESTIMFQNDFKQYLINDVYIRLLSKNNSEYAQFTTQLMNEISDLSPKIKIDFDTSKFDPENTIDPTLILGENTSYKIKFMGTPAGHEANTILQAIKLISSLNSGFTKRELEMVHYINKPVLIQVFVTPACPHCPASAISAIRLAIAYPEFISVEIIEAQENVELSQKFQVTSVPQQVINGDLSSVTIGAQQDSQFIKHLLKYGCADYQAVLKIIDGLHEKSTILVDNPEDVIVLNKQNFQEALKKYPLLIIDFWAEWCVPCRIISPIMDNLVLELKGKAVIAKLDVDENQDISSEYQVESIPAILIFKKGELIHKLIGVKQKKQLLEEIHQFI